jgi:hypothetical protein
LTLLRTIGLDPACAEGVHPERLRKLAREGKAVQRCRLGRSESSVQHPATEVKRLERRRIPESEKV